MTPLRIAQVCADRGIAPGGTKGASLHLCGLAEGFARLGHRVVTYATRPAEAPMPNEVRPIEALGSDDDIDVVYERYSLGHLDGLARARELGVPFVLEVNAPLVDEARAHRPDRVAATDPDAERELLAQADVVVTVSNPLADWISGFRTGPTVVVHNGFEPAWFPVRVGWSSATEAPAPLVFLGHPKPWHGAERLVPLLVELGRRGHHPSLLVIGGGPGVDVLAQAADRAGVAAQVEITGALPPWAASRRLRNAAIGLAPYPAQSPFYFCPLKVVDYLAAGLPVVSNRQGDIADMVGEAGIVLDDPDDDTAFADAVESLLIDPVAWRTASVRGRGRAMSSMTWGRAAAATVEAFRHELGLRRGGGRVHRPPVVGVGR